MKKASVIILISIFLTLLVFNFVSADTWESYGNNVSYMPNAQISSISSRFDAGVVNSSIPYGIQVKNPILNGMKFTTNSKYILDYQPLVASFGNPNTNYLVFGEDNNTDFYTNTAGNLVLINSYPIGATLNSQLDVTDFDGDNLKNDLVGVWSINGTLNSFRVFNFNYSTEVLNKIYEYNITSNMTFYISGVRCIQAENKECMFIYANGTEFKWTAINRTNIRKISIDILDYLPNAYLSPIAFLSPIAYQDLDNDGSLEFLTFTSQRVILRGGDLVTNEIFYSTYFTGILDAKFVKTSSSNIWKIAVLEYYIGGGANYLQLSLLNSNYPSNAIPTILWTKTILGTGADGGMGKLAIGRDYNKDGWQDIYVSMLEVSSSWANAYLYSRVYRGYDGSLLYTNTTSFLSGAVPEFINSLTLADMNNDNYDDFIISFGNDYSTKDWITILDTKTNTSILSKSILDNRFYSCIPADLGKTGLLDLICSGQGTSVSTYLYSSLASNQNAVINSLVFEPATTIPINATLYVFVYAEDNENNTIYYSVKCSDSDSWGANTTNYIQTCSYGSSGIYNLTIGVKDAYHSDYTTFSQSIIVTEVGEEPICGNAICELGENSVNCPSDCPVTEAEETGGMPIPVKIVDTENIEQGLLPEVYYSILAFLSNTLHPFIILILTIFFVLIILTIGVIIKKIAYKVSDMGK